MYKSVFDENKKKPLKESLVFSVSTIDDAFETIKKCVSLIVTKKKSSLAMMLPRIAESVMGGITESLGAIYGNDQRKLDSIKKQVVAKLIRFFKQDAGNTPEEPMM